MSAGLVLSLGPDIIPRAELMLNFVPNSSRARISAVVPLQCPRTPFETNPAKIHALDHVALVDPDRT
jgi:hypothetical protein